MRIREVINEQGITSKELAEKLEMSVSALNQHISGNPSVKILERIATALDVPIWQLFASPTEAASAQSGASSFVCPKCGAHLIVAQKE